MMTYDEIIILKQKLEIDEISTDKAKEIYFGNLGKNIKSWHSNDWKERREYKIKDKCEQCGGIEVLTLQHLSHPKKFEQYYKNSYLYFNGIFNENELNDINIIIEKEDIENYISNTMRELFKMCPKCGWNFRTRIKKPQFVCTKCKHEFIEPAVKYLPEYFDDIYNNSIIPNFNKPSTAPGNRKVPYILLYSEIRNKITNQRLRQIFKDKYQLKIDKKAMVDYLEANIKYLSFEDTITLCKKCAYNQDINKKDLCPVCRKNLKSVQYETCIDCIPDEERKNRIMAQIKFYKEMEEMEKSRIMK